MTRAPHLTWPTRRTLACGLAASLLFAFYGSLVPFDLRELPLADAWQRFAAAWEGPLQISRSDVIANVLLMMPAAFFALGALRVDRRGAAPTLLAALLTMVGGAVCACVLEFSQAFTPDRIVSKSDILAQTTGALLGVLAWLAAGQPLTDWLRGTIGGQRRAGDRRLHALLALYAAGWLLLMALPLNLSLSPADIVHKYRDGGVVLVPFSGPYESRADLVWDTVSSLVAAMPLGGLAALSAMALARNIRARRTLVSAIGLGAAFVLGGEFVQLLVAERIADVTDVLSGCVGMAAGVWLAFRHVQDDPIPALPRVAPSRTPRAALLGACGWLVVLAFYHWKPFAFSTDIAQARERVSQLSLLPLRQYQWEPGVQILTQALVKSGMGLPLGLCLAPALRGRWMRVRDGVRLRWLACGVVAVGVFATIEIGQVFLPSRVPDVTDVLLGCAGTLVGFGIGNALAADLQQGGPRAASASTHEPA